MLQHCLNKEELWRFVEVVIEGGELYEDEDTFKFLMESWRNYDLEFICFATLLSQLLEKKQKSSEDASYFLNKIFSLLEEIGLWIVIEQIDSNFIGYMLRFTRRESMDIQEELIDIRNQLSQYKY